jgi:hypothetical protein
LTAEMRAGERWPGKLPLLRRLRKDEYGGYALGPQEVDRLDWEVRSFVYACLVEHGLPRRRRSKRRPSSASSRSRLGRPTSGFRGRTAEEAATILGLRDAFWRP